MIGSESFLTYARFRYLKWSLAALALAIALYALDDSEAGPSGGTPLGYGLGGTAAAVLLWLVYYGVRKRSYRAQAPLLGWLSAHVYFGAALVVLVPLHAGFQFGWNVHTGAFAILCLTVTTGIVAGILYIRVPTRITANRPGQKLTALLQQIADIDAECRAEVTGMPDYFAAGIAISIDETYLGGGVLRQFARNDRRCGTDRAIARLRDHPVELEDADRDRARRLLELLSLKRDLLARVRRDARYRAILDLWMLLHVPLALGSVAAVAVHVFAVFYYW